ncbi:MAG: hypothetical protein IPF44_17610 [Betaproteobacteria bacterium]|nr:hypothetical protein [Betaproteobacteria bacterium]
MALAAAHQRTRQTYSAVRLQSELEADGFSSWGGSDHATTETDEYPLQAKTEIQGHHELKSHVAGRREPAQPELCGEAAQ